MTVVVEVPDQWYSHAHIGEPAGDFGDGSRGLVVVHSHADEQAAGSRQLLYLERSARSVGGIGVRHRLDDDRMRRSDGYAAYESGGCFSTGYSGQIMLACEQFES